MKKFQIITVSAIALFSSVALAGLVQPAPVIIDLVNSTAQGDMFTARTAENQVEMIGCGVRHFDDGVNDLKWGFCQATDADENNVVCLTFNESLIQTMRTTASYSFITFNWQDDGDGGLECTRIGFSTQSFYLPKK